MVGILLGLPVLRVRGDYLAIVTLGFGEVIRVLANNLDKPLNLTNGPQGITPIQRPTLPQPAARCAGTRSLAPLVGQPVTEGEFYNLFFYLLALLVIAVVILTVIRLDNSRMGRAWTAIREDELAAAAMGIPVVRYKLAAFAVGASFAGVMGVLFAASRTFVSPESFNFMQSIGVLSMVILGGLGSIPGVILGAAVVIILNLQVLQGLSLWLSSLRQSDIVIPLINFACAGPLLAARPGQVPAHAVRPDPDPHDDLPPGGIDPGQAAQARAAEQTAETIEEQPARHQRRSRARRLTMALLEANQRDQALRRPDRRRPNELCHRTRADRQHHRPQRRREDHLLQHPDRHLQARGRPAFTFNGHSLVGQPPGPDRLAGASRRTFQNIRLFGSMTVIENILVGMHYRLQADAGRGAAAQPGLSKRRKKQRSSSAPSS